MRKKFYPLALLFAFLILTLLPACNIQQETSSLKSLTKPYIAEYECYEGMFGGEDILKKFDYIIITLADKENLELIFKLKDGERYKYECEYELDTKTRELSADIWVLGYRFKESVNIEHGKFTVSKTIGSKQLVMKFKTK